MPRIMKQLLYPELSYKIIGLCFEVHNQLGKYRNEQQYADALEQKLKDGKISYKREKFLPTSFVGEKNRNKPDFLIEDRIVVDLKAKRIISKDDYFQMKRYLESSNKELGVIVNFRSQYLTSKRILRPDSEHSDKLVD